MDVPSWVKPTLWGVGLGAVVWWAALSWGLGWVSASTAAKAVDQQTQTAVAAVATPYCVARFQQQPNAVASWQALKKSADNYGQSDYLQKGGWIALRGQKIDSGLADAIANACATNLLALTEIGGVKLSSAN